METASAPERLRRTPSWLLNQAALPANRLVADALASVGARRPHYAVLAALEEFGPASQAALSRRCGIDGSDMVALMSELSVNGLVERAPDPRDRRRNVVRITAAGRDRLRTLDRTLAEVQDEVLAPLPAAEREHLVRLLTAVVDHHAARAHPSA